VPFDWSGLDAPAAPPAPSQPNGFDWSGLDHPAAQQSQPAQASGFDWSGLNAPADTGPRYSNQQRKWDDEFQRTGKRHQFDDEEGLPHMPRNTGVQAVGDFLQGFIGLPGESPAAQQQTIQAREQARQMAPTISGIGEQAATSLTGVGTSPIEREIERRKEAGQPTGGLAIADAGTKLGGAVTRVIGTGGAAPLLESGIKVADIAQNEPGESLTSAKTLGRAAVTGGTMLGAGLMANRAGASIAENFPVEPIKRAAANMLAQVGIDTTAISLQKATELVAQGVTDPKEFINGMKPTLADAAMIGGNAAFTGLHAMRGNANTMENVQRAQNDVAGDARMAEQPGLHGSIGDEAPGRIGSNWVNRPTETPQEPIGRRLMVAGFRPGVKPEPLPITETGPVQPQGIQIDPNVKPLPQPLDLYTKDSGTLGVKTGEYYGSEPNNGIALPNERFQQGNGEAPFDKQGSYPLTRREDLQLPPEDPRTMQPQRLAQWIAKEAQNGNPAAKHFVEFGRQQGHDTAFMMENYPSIMDDAVTYSRARDNGKATPAEEPMPGQPMPDFHDVVPQPTPVKTPIGAGLLRKNNETSQVAPQPAVESAGDLSSEPVEKSEPFVLPYEKYPVVELPLDQLHLSEDVPNFKAGADKKTGVVDPLKGKYSRLPIEPIVAWERNNGRYETITGRHRRELAMRSGEATIPSQVVREKDGFTKDMALILDAEHNIRQGQGTVDDYATYFKHAKIEEAEARERGLLRDVKANTGWNLGKNASDNLWSHYVGGSISEEKAAAIAAGAPKNERIQDATIGMFQSDPKMSADDLRAYAEFRSEHPITKSSKQTDLLGDVEDLDGKYTAQAAAKKRKEIEERIRVASAGLRYEKREMLPPLQAFP
jgi:hypothetical protein